jgi:hypothetical protein
LRRGTGLIRRTVDVPPGTTTLRLGFWTKIHSFEGSEHARVQVRPDGGSTTTVATFTSAQSDNRYRFAEADLTDFLPANQIQITFDANMGDINDNWYLDDIRVTGSRGNNPPVANAGADQTLSDADGDSVESVVLDGSASFDPDGSIVAYEWKEGSTVLANTPTLMVSVPINTSPTFVLTVTDNDDASSSDSVQITIHPNQAPIAHAGPDQPSVVDSDDDGFADVTLDGSGSTDDGVIVEYAWDLDADGVFDLLEISPTVSLPVGTHGITLRVTDNAQATGTDVVNITVSAAPTQPTAMHCGDLDGSAANQGNQWRATVVVTIHDDSHNPVSNATVSIQWGGGVSGTASATTGSDGQCTFSIGNIPKKSSTATLTITDVYHATLAYSATANHDPDGDSNGTSITIAKP